MFCAKTSNPQLTIVSIEDDRPLKSGVRASTAVSGLRSFISFTVSAKCFQHILISLFEQP